MSINVKDKIVVQKVLDYYLSKINAACKANYAKKVSSLPDASEDTKGMILQYIGEDESVYKRGAFYECKLVEDETAESETPVYIYKWIVCFSDIFVEKEKGKGLSSNDYTDDAAEAVSQISNKANKATTLAGYEIEDAYTKTETDNTFVKKETDYSLISKTALNQIDTNKSNLETLMGDETIDGSIAKQIANAIGSKDKLSKEIVDEIPDPSTASEDVIYLVPSGTDNVYLQYMLIGGKMIPLGSTETNLSNYVKKDDIKDFITASDVATYIPSDIPTSSDLDTKMNIDQGTDNAGKYLVVGSDGKVIVKELTTGSGIIELSAREW